MSSAGLWAVGLAILVGLAGVFVPILPGLALIWGAVAVWALAEQSASGWAVLAAVTVMGAAGSVVKYAVPGRRLRDAGVPRSSLLAGAGLALAGFFLIPVVGAVLGFPLGIYLAERHRLNGHRQAWPSTLHALRAVGLSILIEFAAGLLMAGTWLVAAVTL